MSLSAVQSSMNGLPLSQNSDVNQIDIVYRSLNGNWIPTGLDVALAEAIDAAVFASYFLLSCCFDCHDSLTTYLIGR